MVIADLNIICIDQLGNKPCPNCNHMVFEAHNRNNTREAIYPLYDFAAAYKLRGWWYTYWPREELFFRSPFFDLAIHNGRNMIQLYDIWKDSLYSLFSYYLSISPACEIGVLIRLEDKAENTVHSHMCLGCFMEQLLAGTVQYNELYLITQDSNI